MAAICIKSNFFPPSFCLRNWAVEESRCKFVLKAAVLSRTDVSDLANPLLLIVCEPLSTAGFFGSGWIERS